MKSRVPISIRYILSVYLAGLVFFTLFRLMLVFTNMPLVIQIPGKWGIMGVSMFMGLRFDTVVSGYLLILPTVILIIADLCKVLTKRWLAIASWFISVVYTIAFFGCAADVPFFNTFNSRLNVTALNWTSSPMFVVKMIFEEWRYLVFFLVFLAVVMVFVWLQVRIYRRFRGQLQGEGGLRFTVVKLVICIVFLGLELLGIRGRIDEKSPIVAGTAYFSRYDIANQAGLNPVYTFMQSYFDSMKEEMKKLTLMRDEDAILLAQYYLGIPPSVKNLDHPFARKVAGDSTHPKYNVVIVIMESMSANFMQRYGNTQHLTPMLDSLANNGIAFDHFYSAGIHTFNGIYSTMYGFPGLMAKHTMEGVDIPCMTGLPWAAKQNGYRTLYLTTHDDQFDNVGGFTTKNYIDTMISKKDYPSEQVLSTLGVPDHYMFDYCIPILNQAYESGTPFCTFMMTASNHNPYIVPTDIPFKPAHDSIRGGCVEYADWSIGHFLKIASAQKWFSNTVFLFVADHGARVGYEYDDVYIDYNHIPCIIYAPGIIKTPRAIKKPGGQVDIYPTLAGIMGLNYINNTMGLNLLERTRNYMYFTQDDKVGVADTAQLYIWHHNGNESMYKIGYGVQVPLKNNTYADSMKKFAFSMLQSTQWVIDNQKCGPVNMK